MVTMHRGSSSPMTCGKCKKKEATVHVSGTDRKALEAAIAPWRKAPWRWTEAPPTLEDVFIKLMGQAEHNFA